MVFLSGSIEWNYFSCQEAKDTWYFQWNQKDIQRKIMIKESNLLTKLFKKNFWDFIKNFEHKNLLMIFPCREKSWKNHLFLSSYSEIWIFSISNIHLCSIFKCFHFILENLPALNIKLHLHKFWSKSKLPRRKSVTLKKKERGLW